MTKPNSMKPRRRRMAQCLTDKAALSPPCFNAPVPMRISTVPPASERGVYAASQFELDEYWKRPLLLGLRAMKRPKRLVITHKFRGSEGLLAESQRDSPISSPTKDVGNDKA